MRSGLIAIALCSMLISIGLSSEVGMAQIPFFSQIQPPSLGVTNSENRIVTGWVYLDGRRLFSIAAPRASLKERLQNIHDNLTVGLEMDKDALWEHQIIEPPQVLGVEHFGDMPEASRFAYRGLVVRVWIKTQPLKQWDVAREYRRRLKIAFDKAGISIPVPQQAVWLNSVSSTMTVNNEQLSMNSERGNNQL